MNECACPNHITGFFNQRPPAAVWKRLNCGSSSRTPVLLSLLTLTSTERISACRHADLILQAEQSFAHGAGGRHPQALFLGLGLVSTPCRV